MNIASSIRSLEGNKLLDARAIAEIMATHSLHLAAIIVHSRSLGSHDSLAL